MSAELGIVVIGRNEGARLVECLAGLEALNYPTIYVDSGSSDGSLEMARARGVLTLALDTTRPFSAARARNEGLNQLLGTYPGLNLVQFLDGDCLIEPRWLPLAQGFLHTHPAHAAVIGQLQERFPEASVYNRLCQLEWRSMPGRLSDFGAFGGISMVSVNKFQELGGFNPDVIAGEDSELGVRIALAGYAIEKLDAPMAVHDANIMRFAQWWQRAKRSGHAIAQRKRLNGHTPLKDCVRAERSALIWGAILPATLAILSFLVSSAFLLLGGLLYAYLAFRIIRYRRIQGDRVTDAMLYATATIVAKFAQCLGIARYHVSSIKNRFEIIEYK